MFSTAFFTRFLQLLLLSFLHFSLHAQDTLSKTKDDVYCTSFQFCTEFYSSTELSSTNIDLRPDFIYSHKRLNSVSPNLTLLKVAHGNNKFRFNTGLMLGDYSTYNLASEIRFARNIFEANAEVRLSRKKTLWLTAGVFPSHIGVESAIGASCMTLTRSIVADNSPYYETGVKMMYTTPGEKWILSALLLNGWQRINAPVGELQPGLGTQINFLPDKRFTFSWNTYTGKVNGGLRIYNNIYALYSGAGRTSVALSLDAGLQYSPDGTLYSCYSPVVIFGYRWNEKMKSALRLESYNDPDGAIILSDAGFSVNSASVNFDWTPTPFFMLRTEYKYGNSPLNNFNGESQSSLLTGAIIIWVQ